MEDIREVWDGVADGWDRHEDQLARFAAPVRQRLLELLDPRPGEDVVELAAGTGALSRAAATAVGPEGTVHCTDIAPAMVEAARRRAEDAALGNVHCAVAPADDLDLEDSSVDAVVCSFGLMLMPEPDAALQEVRRVLRPGGRLAVSTWGAPERNAWIVLIGGALLQHEHVVQRDPTGPGGVFSLSAPAALTEVMEAAGLRDAITEEVEVTQRFASFDDYWRFQWATGGPIARILRELGPEDVAEVKETCRGFSESFASGDGYVFPGLALVARATSP